MKTITIVIFTIFPVFIFSQDLADVVQAALENNNQIKASGLLTQSARQEEASVERANLPSLSVKATYIHNTDVPQFDVPIPGFNQTVTLNPQDTYDSGLHLDYILFSGFAQSQAEKVKAFELSIARVNEDQNMKDVAYKTIHAYRNAQFMKLSLEILNDSKQRNIIQMKNAKALLENGMALQLDTLSLSLNRMTIDQQIIESQSVLENWFQLLQNLTGKEVILTETIQLNKDPFFNEFSAEEQNPIKNIKLEQNKMSAFAGISKAAYYPRIWLNASFNYGRPGPDIISNEWNTYGKWMIGLQWDLWNWGATKASVQAKDLKAQALGLSEKTLQDQLKLKYDNAVRSFKALQKQSIVSQQAVKVAREKMQIVEVSSEKGQLTASDFNEANLELSQAEIREKQILIQLNLQATEIDYLSGKPVKMWRL